MSKTVQKVLYLGLTWPEPNATAAGVRTLQLLNFFKELGYEITFGSAAASGSYSFDLEKLGIKSISFRLNNPEFDQIIQDLEPQIVVFDRFITEEYFGWRVAKILPEAIRILDTQDLHSLRKTRELAVKAKTEFSVNQWLKAEITNRELASIFRCDLSLIISKFEMEWLQINAPIAKKQLSYYPFVIDDQLAANPTENSDFEARKDFVFIGNGKHQANIDAINYLKESIWPLLHKDLPETSIHIYGAYLPPKIKSLDAPKANFHVHGWIEDAAAMLRTKRVNLIPLRYGAGLKGKFVSSVQSGTPSVLSKAGAEGFNFDKNAINVADNIEDFILKTKRLYSNKALWSQCLADDQERLRICFNKENCNASLKKELEQLINNLQEHRTQNLIGNMLLHHTMASSKYLSKYIALKEDQKKGNSKPVL